MVASIINAVVAEDARDRTEETARGVVVYFPAAPFLRLGQPLEHTQKLLEALESLPLAPPAGHA